MSSLEVKDYLGEIRSHLRLDPSAERQVIGEICAHFRDKVDDLKGQGLTHADAARRAIEAFGRPKVVARLMCDAFGRGSWSDALMAALPHALVAILFASHLWRTPAAGIPVWFFIVCVTLFGWSRGKPRWLYSWIGYSLSPLLIIGFLSYGTAGQAVGFALNGFRGELPGLPGTALVLGFYICAAWVVGRTVVRVVRRDWLLASVMIVPLPIIGSWLFFLGKAGGLVQSDLPPLHLWDESMAMAFLALAAGSATFVRIRKRPWKVIALVLIASTTLVAVGPNLWGAHGFLQLSLFFLLMVVFLLSPALVESKVGHGEGEDDVWWNEYWSDEVSSPYPRS